MIRFILLFMFLIPTLAFAESDEYGHEIEPSPSAVDQLALLNSPIVIAGGSWGFSVNWRVLIAGNMPKKAWLDMMIDSDEQYRKFVDDPAPDRQFKQHIKDIRAQLYMRYAALWEIKVKLWEHYTCHSYAEGRKKSSGSLKLTIYREPAEGDKKLHKQHQKLKLIIPL